MCLVTTKTVSFMSFLVSLYVSRYQQLLEALSVTLLAFVQVNIESLAHCTVPNVVRFTINLILSKDLIAMSATSIWIQWVVSFFGSIVVSELYTPNGLSTRWTFLIATIYPFFDAFKAVRVIATMWRNLPKLAIFNSRHADCALGSLALRAIYSPYVLLYPLL